MIHRCLSILIAILLLWACARPTTPTGGPQDKTAPRLENSIPANNEKNYHGKTITLTFDELIKLKDPKEEIIIAPSPGKDIDFQFKKNTVTIKPKTAWKDSTTYSLSFREAIQDMNEGNPPDNLRLAFSTGPIIDSLRIRGKIADALTEKIPQKITVALHSPDTFDILKHVPAYFTKTDKEGNFMISNLKPGLYRVYAFDDKNKNLKLETKTEQFGFVPGTINLSKSVDTLALLIVRLDSRPPLVSNVRHTDTFSRVKFNKSLTQYSVTMPGKKTLNTFGDDHSEIKFYHHLPPSDSLPVTIHAIDSLDQKIDTLVYIKSGTAGSLHEDFKADLLDSKINSETAAFHATMAFNKPLAKITLDSVFLTIDSLHAIHFSPDDLRYDTAFNKIQIDKQLEKQILGITKPLDFFISANTFISLENDSSKRIRKKIIIPKPEELGTLLLELQTTKKDFEVQLLTPDYKIVQTARNTRKLTFRNITPGEYKIRIVLDTNKNNQWDPGNINKDIPPEATIFFKNTDGKYQFPIRANWEVGPYIIKF